MPFTNPIVGGTALVRTAINSPNYVAGSTGWAIKRDGSAELNSATIRGELLVGPLAGPGLRVTATSIPADLQAFYTGRGTPVVEAVIYMFNAAAGFYNYEALLSSSGTYAIGSAAAGSIAEAWQITQGGALSIIQRNALTARFLTSTGDAAATSSLVLTTGVADVPGASVTLTTGSTSAVWVAQAAFYMQVSVIGATCQGRLNLDGVDFFQPEARFLAPAATAEATVTQVWRGVLNVAGSHTWKLRGLRNVAAGTQTVLPTQTTLTVSVYE